ncbi:NAD(+) synthase, partial [Idiomarina sp. UBA3992]
SDMSLEDAEKQADTLGVRYDVVPIEPMFNEFMTQLGPLFGETETDTTEENLQSRCRGVLLMALSNKTGSLVLATGNKSEMAVGYATLYGDMCGGFAPIKDIPKLLVYQLAEFRNTRGACIPQRVIDRPPSAELAPDQVDSDSLPDYSDLDRILALYVERDWSVTDIIAAGFTEEDVRRVVRLVDLNEYKRRQSAVGPKVTPRNFGKDRRYPITSHYRHELQRQGQ